MFRSHTANDFFRSSAATNWWGTKRVDFALYCPEGLQQFPTAVLSPLFHVSYWESSDVAAFVVREVYHSAMIASVSRLVHLIVCVFMIGLWHYALSLWTSHAIDFFY